MWRPEDEVLAQVRSEARRRRQQRRFFTGLGVLVATTVAVLVLLSVTPGVGGPGATRVQVADGGHAKPRPFVLQAVSGGGDHTGSYFTVPSRAKGWTISWSYSCGGPPSNRPGTGNFHISVQDRRPGETPQAGISEIGSASSGLKHYHDGGVFRVKVISECTWRYTVATDL